MNMIRDTKTAQAVAHTTTIFPDAKVTVAKNGYDVHVEYAGWIDLYAAHGFVAHLKAA